MKKLISKFLTVIIIISMTDINHAISQVVISEHVEDKRNLSGNNSKTIIEEIHNNNTDPKNGAIRTQNDLDAVYAIDKGLKRKYIRKAQRYMQLYAASCIGFGVTCQHWLLIFAGYYFDRASKQSVRQVLIDNIEFNKSQMDTYASSGLKYEDYNQSRLDPKGFAESAERTDGKLSEDELNRQFYTPNTVKAITKGMKALSLKQGRKIEYNFKKNQLLVNKKPMKFEDFLKTENITKGMTNDEKSAFVANMKSISSKLAALEKRDEADLLAGKNGKGKKTTGDEDLIGALGPLRLKTAGMNKQDIQNEMSLLIDELNEQAEKDLKNAKADEKDLLKNRTPSNVAGFNKDYNGDPIGLSTDSIFLMITKRYKAHENTGAFK